MGEIRNISFDHCLKCTICTMYCPVAKETSLFPGPKQSGPDAERLRIKSPQLVDSSLKLCTNCKRCEIACPSDVKIAEIIQEAKWKYLKGKIFRPRDFFMSHTDLIGQPVVLFAPIVNFFMNLKILKFFMELFLKIPFKRKLPKYNQGSFRKEFRKKLEKKQGFFMKEVTYFHGCYVNYNDKKLGTDTVEVLNSMGFGVRITKEKCCGVPLIANGYLEKAKKNGLHNIKVLSENENSGKILSTSSSCSFALTHEYDSFLKLDNSSILNRTEYITRFLYERFSEGNIPEMGNLALRAAYHSPCHLERQGGLIYTIGILKKIPGLELIILNAECCGIAGTFGFKSENYELSQDIGENLFKQIEEAEPEIVITDCETCKMQIEMNTKYRVLHPVTVLKMAIDRGKNNEIPY